MRNFLKQVFFFIATICSMTKAKPTLPYVFSTKTLAGLGKGIGVERTVHLYSKNSAKYIRINNNSVDGFGNRSDPNAQLVLESAGFKGQVRIKSSDGSRYLCMSGHGSLMVENKNQGQSLNRCVFYQVHHPKGYTAYRSKIQANWYLAIRRNGAPKSAKKVRFSQRAAHFMELR
ncbi:fibroblast growth factor 8-like [Actinia tenebrosa]|uniref:Fibroblast growth factor 8-like n=1 Tax=Actinia tenebrosa TaxID=6105 RepID=A0A6P8IEV6_ACTTE|nr:fibroblast growth factor 8-like [Actinia tenebrosa]